MEQQHVKQVESVPGQRAAEEEMDDELERELQWHD